VDVLPRECRFTVERLCARNKVLPALAA